MPQVTEANSALNELTLTESLLSMKENVSMEPSKSVALQSP